MDFFRGISEGKGPRREIIWYNVQTTLKSGKGLSVVLEDEAQLGT